MKKSLLLLLLITPRKFALVFGCTMLIATRAICSPTVHYTWTGVDVVTMDFNKVDKIRELTNIKSGDRYPINSPLLAKACANVREGLKLREVRCTAIEMEHFTALYVVQVGGYQQAKTNGMKGPCKEVGPNGDLIRKLYDSILQSELNEIRGLDFNSPIQIDDSFKLDERHKDFPIQQEVLRYASDVLSSVESCSALERIAGVSLLPYLGLPSVALSKGITLSDDPDENVRNAARRITSTLAKFATAEQSDLIVQSSCSALESSASFFDRNKSLMNLLSVVQHNPLIHLPSGCADFVAAISRTSSSPQLGMPAEQIIRKINEGLARSQSPTR
ncbi:hypothetical protein GTP41_01895 [Pseudoduganella sp. DS3]|uniref:Uncharacterized protein n=1 Tax=Pseudoduganella guangdongensis TaxID=2692179 RepID=A0A6N9HCT7_9BURK|nr:hypothetical protein [Pseudoduganella guangdongensis]MYN00843.1 hypothetical protein [Pseudoduganella guangdongensis]